MELLLWTEHAAADMSGIYIICGASSRPVKSVMRIPLCNRASLATHAAGRLISSVVCHLHATEVILHSQIIVTCVEQPNIYIGRFIDEVFLLNYSSWNHATTGQRVFFVFLSA